jgi:hypothetical protein
VPLRRFHCAPPPQQRRSPASRHLKNRSRVQPTDPRPDQMTQPPSDEHMSEHQRKSAQVDPADRHDPSQETSRHQCDCRILNAARRHLRRLPSKLVESSKVRPFRSP